MRVLWSATLLIFVAGCDPDGKGRPPLPDGLGQACEDDADCEEGATCHSYAHPECPDAQCKSCEVVCDSDEDCPEGLACNLPPLVPDEVPNLCESLDSR